MSETLCTLRTKGGGGGKYTETSLWTNSAPTSSFASQSVTLSDSISNYKYLAFAFKGVTSSTTVVRAVVSVEDLGNMSNNAPSPSIRLSGQGTYAYSRYVIKASDTTITFGTAYAANVQSTDNSRAIPVEILGLNELDHAKGFDETVLWTNSAPTTGASSFSCTLSDDWTNYDYIKVSACLSTSSPTNVLSTMFAKDELAKCRTVSGTNSFNISLTLYLGSGGFYTRRGTVNVANNTTISFGQASQLGGTGTNSNYLIPVSIAGCKFR